MKIASVKNQYFSFGSFWESTYAKANASVACVEGKEKLVIISVGRGRAKTFLSTNSENNPPNTTKITGLKNA